MGELVEGINGPVRGKVGNLVFYTRDGKTFVRTKPRRRGKKRTADEKNNTTGFAKVQEWMKPIGYFIKHGFKNYGVSKVPYRSAVSYALNNAVKGTYPNQFIDPSLVRVTAGDLPLPESASFVLEDAGVVRFNWDKGDLNSWRSKDQAMILVYSPYGENKNHESHMAKANGAFRKDGTDILLIQPARYDQEFHFYLGFVNSERTQQSNSIYLGSTFIAGMEQDELFDTFKSISPIRTTKMREAEMSARDKAFEIARNLRNIGLTDADITATTGLSLEDLENLPPD